MEVSEHSPIDNSQCHQETHIKQSAPTVDNDAVSREVLNEDHTVNFAVLPAIPPILEGHVFKKSLHHGFARFGGTFKKRYFILYTNVILYYDHKSSFEKDKHHGLKHAKHILLHDLYLTHPTHHKAHHCFELHVPHSDNKRTSYLLAMSDRKSRNIWIEMLQQQNPQLEPPISEVDGHPKPIPGYINMIRTLATPSPVLKTKSLPEPERVKISELENYHYERHRRETWTPGQHMKCLKADNHSVSSSSIGSAGRISPACFSQSSEEDCGFSEHH